MNIVIIEDERLTSDDLAETLVEYDTSISIVAQLKSVKESIAYFQKQTWPDLIFSDIQLGDGLSFEIFKSLNITVPVIFCTAFNEYALDAFRANGVDYLLKPFSKNTVGAAIEKFKRLTNSHKVDDAISYSKILDLFESKNSNGKSSLLVYYKEKIKPIKIEDIAVFYLEEEVVHLVTFDRNTFVASHNLEELETLVGSNFFRANRQSLIQRKAVSDVVSYMGRKLLVNMSVPIQQKITVSKEKSPVFLDWLSK